MCWPSDFTVTCMGTLPEAGVGLGGDSDLGYGEEQPNGRPDYVLDHVERSDL